MHGRFGLQCLVFGFVVFNFTSTFFRTQTCGFEMSKSRGRAQGIESMIQNIRFGIVGYVYASFTRCTPHRGCSPGVHDSLYVCMIKSHYHAFDSVHEYIRRD